MTTPSPPPVPIPPPPTSALDSLSLTDTPSSSTDPSLSSSSSTPPSSSNPSPLSAGTVPRPLGIAARRAAAAAAAASATSTHAPLSHSASDPIPTVSGASLSSDDVPALLASQSALPVDVPDRVASPLKARDYASPMNPSSPAAAPSSSSVAPPSLGGAGLAQMRAASSPVLPVATPGTGGPSRMGLGGQRVGGGIGGSGGRPVIGGMRGGMGLGTTKMPPSLAAKLAANAAKGSSGATPPSSSPHPGTPSLSSQSSPSMVLQPGQRLDASSLLSSRPGSSSLTPGGRAAGPGAKRAKPGLKLGDMHGGAGPGSFTDSNWTGGGRGGAPGGGGGGMQRNGVGMTLSGMGALGNGDDGRNEDGRGGAAPFENFSKIVDPSGRLQFGGKAVIHAKGVDFSNGSSFAINMEQLTLLEELGKGNYGTVQKVYHKPTNVTMAMKEIRLELDDSKLKGIITELDILHRATAPEIVDFYGAFFIESCVYYCMEYMDAGSLEQLASPGVEVPEDVLSRVTACMVRGLRFLKDELQTMHRDVKPTNVLVSRTGAIKLCDFGVSGQLERSLAKTNIGCQSYMAPERIKGESVGSVASYTVSSDVWSLGLSIIEFAVGHYPYPPETYQNVFAQLQAIVHGDPPELPEGYSDVARDFVRRCLEKNPDKRPTYKQLLQHPFLKKDEGREVDMKGWVEKAISARERRKEEVAAARAAKLAEANGTSPVTTSNSSSSSTTPASNGATPPEVVVS